MESPFDSWDAGDPPETDYEEDSFPEELDLDEISINPDCKYPHIKVQLVGRDGNAFSIIAHVREGLKEAGVSREERDAFRDAAMASGSYEQLLNLATQWVAVY